VDYRASAALLNISNLDAVPIQRVPTIMDFNFLPDMGTMNGQWQLEEKTGSSVTRWLAPRRPRTFIRSSKHAVRTTSIRIDCCRRLRFDPDAEIRVNQPDADLILE
jgi:hypothetical protein